MTRVKSEQKTAIQIINDRQKQALSKLPHKSPKRSAVKARYAEQKASIKKEQSLLSRIRATYPKNQRKKLKPVKYLSPETIRKETSKAREEGHKIRPTKQPLKPPKEGHVTDRCFTIPKQNQQLRAHLNAIFTRYHNEGGPRKSLIRGWRAIIETGSGEIVSTPLVEPSFFDGNIDIQVMGMVQHSDPTVDTKKMTPKKICIIISWKVNYPNQKKGI